MHVQRLCVVSALLAVAACLGAQPPAGKTIEINIKKFKFIEKGQTAQKPVVVKVGDTVVWKNLDKASHNAISKALNKSGKPLFDTGEIAPGKTAKVVFDAELLKAAPENGKIVYHCDLHEGMKSEIVLKK